MSGFSRVYKNNFSKEYSHVAFLNKRRTAIFYMRIFIKRKGVKSKNQKLKHLIKTYAHLIGEFIDESNPEVWLVKRYLAGEDYNIRPLRDEYFYSNSRWVELREEVLDYYGEICMKCGSKEHIAVDHILPYSLFPEKRLDFNNMQVLCRSCNSSKSNRKYTDYRPKEEPEIFKVHHESRQELFKPVTKLSESEILSIFADQSMVYPGI